MAQQTAGADDGQVGTLLRRWREHRRYSQLELSGRTGVSTRHLSFMENGRARPTAEMVLRLAEHLEVPLAERDTLLLAAGFAPRYARRDLDHADLGPVLAGLRGLLDAHHPWPALLLDEHWDVVDANTAVDVLLQGCSPTLLEPPLNALRLSLHPDGLAPRILNLEVWAAHLVQQVQHRFDRTRDPVLADLLTELAHHVPTDSVKGSGTSSPVVTLELVSDGTVLRLFSIASQVEMPTDSVVQGLHLETFLPADDVTRQALTDLAEGRSL